MIKEKSTLLRKLKSYSAAAGSVLATATAAHAQVVYTDIVPDTTLKTDGATYDLDLNNDSVFDYEFTMAISANAHGAQVIPLYSVPNTLYNAIGGSLKKNAHNANYGYPYAYSLGKNIDDGVKFFDLRDLVFKQGTGYAFFPPFMAYTYGGVKYGNWFNEKDMFVPLRISTTGGNYYGWVRCDVDSSGKSITLKDYAYNSQAGQFLFAGQGNPTGVSNIADQNIKVFAFDGTLNVTMGNEKINNASLQITNMLGQMMKTIELTKSTTHLNVADLSYGVYIVTINNDGKTFTTKVALQK